MKNFLILTCIITGLFGCQEVHYPKKPENLISKEKMIDILTETYLANAARSVDRRSIESQGIRMDSLIYRNFGIDSLQFVRSNAYYAADINTYMEIFEKVTKNLSAAEKKVDSIFDAEVRKNSGGAPSNEMEKAEPVRDSLI